MISALRKLLLPALPSEPLRWVQAEDLWHEARILIADLAERAQAQHRLHTERLAHALTVSGATLLATQQVAALTGAVGTQLPRLGIPGAWMTLTDRGRPTSASATAQMEVVLAHDVERAPGGSEPRARNQAGRRRAAAGGDRAARPPGLGHRRAALLPRPHARLPAAGDGAARGDRLRVAGRAGLERARGGAPGRRAWSRRRPAARSRSAQRLEKEMEIATRIQTSILPRDVTVPGLEIAATMRTATEVGGDYYDVIPVARRLLDRDRRRRRPRARHRPRHADDAERDRRALRASCPTPHRASCCWRSTRCWSTTCAMRLGQREHATLTLLRYRQDGGLAFAGAHEEILILRAATGRCERLATPGPWVGAKRDIEAGTVESNVQLHARRSAGALHRRPHRGDGARRPRALRHRPPGRAGRGARRVATGRGARRAPRAPSTPSPRSSTTT